MFFFSYDLFLKQVGSFGFGDKNILFDTISNTLELYTTSIVQVTIIEISGSQLLAQDKTFEPNKPILALHHNQLLFLQVSNRPRFTDWQILRYIYKNFIKHTSSSEKENSLILQSKDSGRTMSSSLTTLPFIFVFRWF